MNSLLFTGISLNAVLTYTAYSSGAISGTLTVIAVAFWVLSLVGSLLIEFGVIKPGAIIAIVGCTVFLPLGIFGIVGACQVLKRLKHDVRLARLDQIEGDDFGDSRATG